MYASVCLHVWVVGTMDVTVRLHQMEYVCVRARMLCVYRVHARRHVAALVIVGITSYQLRMSPGSHTSHRPTLATGQH